VLNSNNNDTLLDSFCRYSNKRLIWIRRRRKKMSWKNISSNNSTWFDCSYSRVISNICMHIDIKMKAIREEKEERFWHSSDDGFVAGGQIFVFSIFSLSSLSSLVVFLCSHRILTAIIDRSKRHTNEENMYMIRLIFCFFFSM
jgi:hypothetical protein